MWRLGGLVVASCSSGVLFVSQVGVQSASELVLLVRVLALPVDERGVVAVLPGLSGSGFE